MPGQAVGGGKSASEIYVNFIDIMFAVVIGQSFVFLSSPERFPAWLAAWSTNFVRFVNVVLAYTLVVTSWVGYHRSVVRLPIRGPARFVVDLELLFLYYLAFVSVETFTSILLILFVVFISYTVWTIIRVYEYRTKARTLKLWSRTVHAAVFSAIYGVIWWLANLGQFPPQADGVFITVAFVLLIIYRLLAKNIQTSAPLASPQLQA